MSRVAGGEVRPVGDRLRLSRATSLLRHWDWFLLTVALGVAFRPLLRGIPGLWFGDDTYYAHGSLVPICAGIVVWERLPELRKVPLVGTGWALFLLLPLLYLDALAGRTSLGALQAILLLATLAAGVFYVAGWRILRLLLAPLAFLAFGLPVFDGLVEANTVTAQHLSSDAAFALFRALGMHPRMEGPTTVALSRYALEVAAPCSGMHILLAVAAFSTFFVLVAGLRPWRNVVLVAAVLPLALLVNALRITLIGLIGNACGAEAGSHFHDASGYVSLGVCFGLLYGLTRVLGWK